MGCDIHIFAEVKKNGKWEKVGDHFSLDDFDKKYSKKEKGDEPFSWLDYSLFAFFAGVRNYDHCVPISEQKGLPADSEYLNEESDDGYGGKETRLSSTKDNNYHSFSYLTLRELIEFDYDKTFWNRRISRGTYSPDGFVSGSNGACLAEEGEGEVVSYRQNLGDAYFKHLAELKELGEPDDVRIVFWFDN